MERAEREVNCRTLEFERVNGRDPNSTGEGGVCSELLIYRGCIS